MGKSPSRGSSHFRRSLLNYCSKGFSSSILLPSSPPGFAALSSQAASVPVFPPRRSAKLRRSCQTNMLPPEFQNTERGEMLNPDLTSKSDVLNRHLPSQAKMNIPRLFLTRHLSSTLTWRELSGPQKVVLDEYRNEYPFILFLGRPYNDSHPTHLVFRLHTDVTISESRIDILSLTITSYLWLSVAVIVACALTKLFCCPGLR